jgi:hypothetical protein
MTALPLNGKHVQIRTAELHFLEKLRAMPADLLQRADIGELNLICAFGLPDAEDLPIPHLLQTLDGWAASIRQLTDANFYRFHANPAEYDHSEPYWRMLILATVLQEHYGIKYDRDKIANMDWRDPEDLFIHGLLGPRRSGTCPSLPVLVAALARRLGYPIGLVLAPGHLFSRWDDPQTGVYLNLECHGNGLVTHPDDYYHHVPVEWMPELHAEEERLGPNRVFLRSLRPAEELAFFLVQRGQIWQSHGCWPEATAVYNLAADLSPHHPAYAYYGSEAWRKMADPVYQLDERPRWKGVAVKK